MGRLVKTIEKFTLNRFHSESLIDCLRTYVHSIKQIFATKDAEHLHWLLLIVLTISYVDLNNFIFFIILTLVFQHVYISEFLWYTRVKFLSNFSMDRLATFKLFWLFKAFIFFLHLLLPSITSYWILTVWNNRSFR